MAGRKKNYSFREFLFFKRKCSPNEESDNYKIRKVMREVGVDISEKKTKSVFDYFKEGTLFNYVITVCDQASGEKCPVFPGRVKRLHWSFSDPSTFQGTYQEKLEKTRQVRDEIKEAISRWLKGLDNNR